MGRPALSGLTGSMGLLATIGVMAESDSARGPDESLPWSLLPEPPGLTALESAIGDLDEAMQPSTTMQESVRLLESASLGICDVADRIKAYLLLLLTLAAFGCSMSPTDGVGVAVAELPSVTTVAQQAEPVQPRPEAQLGEIDPTTSSPRAVITSPTTEMAPATTSTSATTAQPEQSDDAEQANSGEVGVSGDTPGVADLGLGGSCFIPAAFVLPRVLPWGDGFLAFGCTPEWTDVWEETRQTFHTSADGLLWSAVGSVPLPFADLSGRDPLDYHPIYTASDGQRLLLAAERGDRILVSITGDLANWDTHEVVPTQPDGLPHGVRAETRAENLTIGPHGWLLLTSTRLGVDLRVLAPADVQESAVAIRFGLPESRGLTVEWRAAGQEPDDPYHTRFVTWEELGIAEDSYRHYGVLEYAMRPHTPNDLRSSAVWAADWGGEPVRADLPDVRDTALWTVVGTDAGYVGLPWLGGPGCPSPVGEMFYSPDGLTWNAINAPGGVAVSLMGLSAVENGVLVSGHEWDGSSCNPVTSHLWRGDATGSNWRPVELPGLPEHSSIIMWDGGAGAVGTSVLTEGDRLAQWIVGSRNGVDWLVEDNAEPAEFSATINGNVMVAIDRQGNPRRFAIP